MPLFLRALPLSFKTFWRYLLVLPLLGIVALFLLFAGMIPVIGYFIPGVVYCYCIMTGLRCALVARGHRPQSDFSQLLRQGFVFSLMTMAATFVIKAVAGLLPLGVFSALGWLATLTDQDPRILVIAGSTFSLYILLMLVWSAALAVPMVAAVSDGGDGGTGINPFNGLGAGLFGLTVINLIWMIGGNFFSIFGEVITMFALVTTTAFSLANGKDIAWPETPGALWMLGATLFMTWASSWFFSAAVLYWEARVSRTQRQAAGAAAPRPSSNDLRALLEARMPNHHAP